MSTTVKARFASGVLKPLKKLALKEGEEVMVTIEPLPSSLDTAWLDETFGSWIGLVDAEELKRRVNESRVMVSRPQPRL